MTSKLHPYVPEYRAWCLGFLAPTIVLLGFFLSHPLSWLLLLVGAFGTGSLVCGILALFYSVMPVE